MGEHLLSLFDNPRSGAVLSPCGTYRYSLTRQWDGGELVGWVMLNPSTADADADDPTIRRCVAFAKSWGYAGIVVRNLYALRATDPRELDQHPDPIGLDKDWHLSQCSQQTLTVLAWGARGGDRGRHVRFELLRKGARTAHLALTADGQPRHPLYLKRDCTPIPEVFDA